MSKSVKNKVVIITGSSMGIGKATAKIFAEKGANVIINGRNKEKLKTTEEELNSLGLNVTAISGDVLKNEDCINLLNKTLEKFGKIDILINNAGISSRGMFEDLSFDVIENVINVNYLAAAKATKTMLPEIKKTKGSIIFISSVAGIRGLPGVSAYSAAKMALTGLAESLRLELKEDNINIGIIYVGYTKNEADKKILGSNGNLIPLAERKSSNAQSIDYVAKRIYKSTIKRKFKTIFSLMGKINYIFNLFFPRFVDKLLILSLNRIKKMSE